MLQRQTLPATSYVLTDYKLQLEQVNTLELIDQADIQLYHSIYVSVIFRQETHLHLTSA